MLGEPAMNVGHDRSDIMLRFPSRNIFKFCCIRNIELDVSPACFVYRINDYTVAAYLLAHARQFQQRGAPFRSAAKIKCIPGQRIKMFQLIYQRIKQIITIEEHVLDGGFGSAVQEVLMDNQITDVTLKRIGIRNTFVEHGPQDILQQEYEIDHTAIIRVALEMKGHARVRRSICCTMGEAIVVDADEVQFFEGR